MENFSAGVLDRWGIGYEQVRAWNPGIVYVTMSGPGHDGPWSKMITYAPTIHALCGLTYLSNPPDRRDVGPGFSLNDHAAGLSSAVAVLSAIEARRRTGEGQHVDIAQMETGTYLIGPAVLDYLRQRPRGPPDRQRRPVRPVVPERGVPLRRPARGRHHLPRRRRLGAAVRDGGVGHRRPRRRPVAGDGGRAGSPASPRSTPGCAEWCASRTADAAAEALQANGVPAGMVQDAGDLIADPQLVARDFWRTHRPRRVRRAALRPLPGAVEHAPTSSRTCCRAAYIGEHNFDVYRDLAGIERGRRSPSAWATACSVDASRRRLSARLRPDNGDRSDAEHGTAGVSEPS